jgi:two-component system chemotaxis response regulator CheB
LTKVLIVDDSPTARHALRAALEADGDISVVGELPNGDDVLPTIAQLAPDLITMDVFLAKENGLDVASRIMEHQPTPILVVTAADSKNPRLVYRTLEAGALEVVAKLPHPTSQHYAERRRRMARLVRTLAEVPVVRRRRLRSVAEPVQPSKLGMPSRVELGPHGVGLVVIGASTGGPPAVARLLRELTSPFPVPIAIVQHIMGGFAAGHCQWLGDATGHRTELCESIRELAPGRVYLAADDHHLHLVSPSHIGPERGPPRAHQRPSVDTLFESAAHHLRSRAIGVLMTGMGSDGARGLVALRSGGATTLAQEPTSCAVDSMPRTAIDAGAVHQTGAPLELAQVITRVCRVA